MRYTLALAFIVLSRLPLAGTKGFARLPSARDLARASMFYPLVGMILAILASAGAALVAFLFTSVMATPQCLAWIIVAITIVLTGAMHLDGLADTCDALGAGSNRERALSIMRDSRIGSFGALAIAMAILAEWLATSKVLQNGQLNNDYKWWTIASTLAASYGFGRLVGTCMVALGQPARADDTSLAAQSIRESHLGHAVVATLIWLSMAWAIGLPYVFWQSLGAWLLAGTLILRGRHRFGGLTGDVTGAGIQGAIVTHLALCAAGFCPTR